MRAALGADRLVQPARDQGPRGRRPSSPATRPTIATAGTRSGPSTAASRRPAREFERSASSAGRRRCPRARSSTSRRCLNLYVYPAEIDYARARPLGADVAPPRLVRARDRRERSSSRRARTRATGSSSTSRSEPRLGRRRADARLVEVLGASPHRFIVSKGPQHERVRARRQHVGRRVPAAAGDPAASSTS